MKDQESFKPYIPAEKITAEMTATSVIMGIILSVVFGAANAPFLHRQKKLFQVFLMNVVCGLAYS